MNTERNIYLNRDLSWLSFNGRVLEEAADPTVALYNRFLFLSIFSSNLDEFFRVRMPAIFAFSGLTTKKISLEEEYPAGLVQQVQQTIQLQQEEFGRILRDELIPALKSHQIYFCYDEPLPVHHLAAIREYFLSTVMSFLQPVFIHRIPPGSVFLENNALYFILESESGERPGEPEYILLNIPSAALPRFLELPAGEGWSSILFLDDIIRACLTDVFPDRTIQRAWSVKLTRNADMNLEDEFAGNLAEKIEKQLEKRDAGPATRLLVDGAMPERARLFVLSFFELDQREIVMGGRYHHLKDLAGIPVAKRPGLAEEAWPPLSHPGFDLQVPVIESIRKGDQLLHIPYHSYHPILRFFNEAALDPAVREIYITLYRVAPDSHIVHALMSAARNGKSVTVFVELKARFDEANNLKWSKKMKAAGIKIISSIPTLKVHAKVAMLRRMEKGEMVDYCYLGTGNFNELTGRFYTDHGFFTASKAVGQELQLLFSYLLSGKQPEVYGKIPFHHLLVSQFNLVRKFDKLIRQEISRANEGRPAGIIIKMNNLQERSMIDRLYEASRAGVKIQLLVRGICCLAPGVEGQSENITVTRIVDRYLEHARVFVFHNDGEPVYIMGSADWMNRNLHSRIEVCFKVEEPRLKSEIATILDLQLKDNCKASYLIPQMENKRVLNDAPRFQAQEAIYQWLTQSVASAAGQ
ncbi:MAG TPA: polyphosphate kinase 1 [Chitinophagaceae bacterium]|nr:polyphosphate kinase 1 [Chitinophagaceae bacterium]HPH32774.1 polyphosphate kinase 1 [Chitinophagaceae bacterium]HPN59887.1 polyphosphate kinase 1 [Chitinophagaceae bacterium]